MLTLIFSTFDLLRMVISLREALVKLLLARASRIIVRFPVSGQYPTAGQIFKLHLKELGIKWRIRYGYLLSYRDISRVIIAGILENLDHDFIISVPEP